MIRLLANAFNSGNTPAPHPATSSRDSGPVEKPDILQIMGGVVKDGRR